MLNEEICNEILEEFERAARIVARNLNDMVSGVGRIAAETSFEGMRSVYNMFQQAQGLPSVNGIYLKIVETQKEKQLAQELESSLSRLVENLEMTRYYYDIGGNTNHPVVSTEDFNRIDRLIGVCAQEILSALDSVQPSVDRKFASPVEKLASQISDILERTIYMVQSEAGNVQQSFESGLVSCIGGGSRTAYDTLYTASVLWTYETE